MDGRGISRNDLQCYCAELAKEYSFASLLNSQARQVAADRAWCAISRFYENCKNQQPGKKGHPQFQHDNRSVEYKTTGWALSPDGKHITFTDGWAIGRLRLVGSPNQRIEEFSVKRLKRARLIRRADGYYCQFAVRTHLCSGCGMVLDRDHNAAINILARALNRTGGQSETGTSSRVRNASGQTTSTRSSRKRKVGKWAG